MRKWIMPRDPNPLFNTEPTFFRFGRKATVRFEKVGAVTVVARKVGHSSRTFATGQRVSYRTWKYWGLRNVFEVKDNNHPEGTILLGKRALS